MPAGPLSNFLVAGNRGRTMRNERPADKHARVESGDALVRRTFFVLAFTALFLLLALLSLDPAELARNAESAQVTLGR